MNTLDFSQARFLLTDVDDTLTTHGRLLPQTYQALWALADAGIHIIPVTGGCAGWCDQIIRTWPVAGVIGESGGFYIVKDAEQRTRWHYWQDIVSHRSDQAAIVQTVDDLALPFDVNYAKDQSFRHVDVAIDYNQDASLTPVQADTVVHLLRQAGFSVKKSSIHINVWRGAFDKGAMAHRMLAEQWQLTETQMQQQVVFVGDAPNDESMFEFFPNSVGVANIARHLEHMTHHPKAITPSASGNGVTELIQTWLATKGQATTLGQ